MGLGVSFFSGNVRLTVLILSQICLAVWIIFQGTCRKVLKSQSLQKKNQNVLGSQRKNASLSLLQCLTFTIHHSKLSSMTVVLVLVVMSSVI